MSFATNQFQQISLFDARYRYALHTTNFELFFSSKIGGMNARKRSRYLTDQVKIAIHPQTA